MSFVPAWIRSAALSQAEPLPDDEGEGDPPDEKRRFISLLTGRPKQSIILQKLNVIGMKGDERADAPNGGATKMKQWEWTWNRDGTEHLITVKEEGEGYFTVWADDWGISVRSNRGSKLSRAVFGTDEIVHVFGSELRLTVRRRSYGIDVEPRADLFENGRSLRDGSTLAERREKLRAAVRKEAESRWRVSALWFVTAAVLWMTDHQGYWLAFSCGMSVVNAVGALFRTKAAKIRNLLPDEPGNEPIEAENASS